MRILIVDDHPLVREGVRTLINHQSGLEVVGEAADADGALEAIARLEPALVLTDIGMKQVSGIALAAQIRQHGVFNFMLSNGDALFTHCSTHLHYLVRQAPFSTAHLIDNDVNIDFAEVTTPNDRVAVIATLPLTDNEAWTAHPKDTVLVFHEGAPLALPAAACQT